MKIVILWHIIMNKQNNTIKYIIFVWFIGVVGATAMNVSSSRSHAIFTITVESSQLGEDGEQHVKMGKLHLVDLAVWNSYDYYINFLLKMDLLIYDMIF